MCNRICFKFAVRKMSTCSMYSLGFKMCNECDCYLYSDDCLINNGGSKICPCCFLQVRSNPRSKKNMIVVRN